MENTLEKLVPVFVSAHIREYACAQIMRANQSRLRRPPRAARTERTTEEVWRCALQSPLPPSVESLHETCVLLDPVAMEGWAAVVMCDVSGYSSLASVLADRGPDGAEILGQIMKEYLDKIIDIITQHGGDIVKFVGDAVIFYWKYRDPSKKWLRWAEHTVNMYNKGADAAELSLLYEKVRRQRRGEPVLKATQCCLDLLNKLGRYKVKIPGVAPAQKRGDTKMFSSTFSSALSPGCPVHVKGMSGTCTCESTRSTNSPSPQRQSVSYEQDRLPDDERELKIHLGIGAGKIFDVHVGGPPGRWEHFVVGEAMEQLAVVLDLAKAGQVALSKKAFEWFQHCVLVKSVVLDSFDTKKYYIVRTLEESAINMLLPDLEESMIPNLPDGSATRLGRMMGSTKKVYRHNKEEDGSINSVASMPLVEPEHVMVSRQELLRIYKLYINESAIFKLEIDLQTTEGHSELMRMSELRQVTTVFIKIGSLSFQKVEMAEDQINEQKEYINVKKAELKQHELDLTKANGERYESTLLMITEAKASLLQSEKALEEVRLDFENELRIALRRCQMVMTVVQKYLKKHDGILRQFHVDDKGAVVLAFFGLPPKAHKDDAPLGLEATLGICEQLKKEFGSFSIGVTTGTVYIGGVGGTVRSEYALIGDSINMAARLMGQPAAKKSVVCDERTKNLSSALFEIKYLGKVLVKGKANPIEIYQPIAKRSAEKILGDGIHFRMIGRERECSMAKTYVEGFLAGQTNIFVVEAESGQGLSTFGNYVRHMGEAYKFNVCVGNCVESERQTPFFPFRAIVRTLLAFLETEDDDNVTSVDIKSLRDSEFELCSGNTLLKLGLDRSVNDLLGLIFPDEGKPVNTRLYQAKLNDLCDFLSKAFQFLNSVMVLVLDIHHIDKVSLELIQALVQQCPNTFFAMFSQPLRRNVTTFPLTFNVITISSLNEYEIGLLIMEQWNSSLETNLQTRITAVDGPIISKVYQISYGNPLFASSLIATLKEKKLYNITDDGLLVLNSKHDFDKIVPGSDLHAIIVSQFDRLSPAFQSFLKMASILGQTFSLADVIAANKGDEEFLKNLDALDKFNFLVHPEYDICSQGIACFKNSIIRESIYSSMLASQRQQMHLNFAKYYESRLPSGGDKLIIKVLEHYQKTEGNVDKKIEYLILAGHYYFSSLAMSETVQTYATLFGHIEKKNPEFLSSNTTMMQYTQKDLSNWYKELGTAYYVIDQHVDAENWLRRALTVLHATLPNNFIKTRAFFQKLKLKYKAKENASVKQVMEAIVELNLFVMNRPLFMYCVFKLYNVSNRNPGITAKTGYALYMNNSKSSSSKYIKQAMDQVNESIPQEMAQVYSNAAVIEMLSGNMEKAADLFGRTLCIPNLRVSLFILETYQCSILMELLRENYHDSRLLARELESRAAYSGWRGVFWAVATNFFIDVAIECHLERLGDYDEQLRLLHEGGDTAAFIVECIRLNYSLDGRRVRILTGFLDKMELLQWPATLGVLTMLSCVSQAADEGKAGTCIDLMRAIQRAMRRMQCAYSNSIEQVARGLEMQIAGKLGGAVRTWAAIAELDSFYTLLKNMAKRKYERYRQC